MEDIDESQRDTSLSWICELLSKICSKDRKDEGTTNAIHEKGCKVEMGKERTRSLLQDKGETDERKALEDV